MIIEEVVEFGSKSGESNSLNRALVEARSAITAITADSLISAQANLKESDKSISKLVSGSIKQNLRDSGWESNWSFNNKVSSTHATFDKKWQSEQTKGLVVLDIGSKASDGLLGFLLKGQLAAEQNSLVEGHVVICFTRSCLKWGLWNGKVASFEDAKKLLPLLSHRQVVPSVLMGVGPADGLEITKTVAGTLRLARAK